MSTTVIFLDDHHQVVPELAPVEQLVGFNWRSLPVHVDGSELVDEVRDADVLVAMRERTKLTRDVLEQLPDLKLIVTTGTRSTVIDFEAAAERGIVVCNAPGIHSNNAAEMAWALILAVQRNILDDALDVRAGGWNPRVGRELHGGTLGIIGLGRLGSQVARVGQAFGMRVTAWSENLTAEAAAEVGVDAVPKDELFSTADVISVHMRLSARSRGLVGREDLRRMKQSAIIVNTSRGPVIDEPALVEALESGWIAGAGLDVFSDEPLPVDHPLRSHPAVVATPHIGYMTHDYLTIWFREVVEDITNWASGKPIRVIEWSPAPPSA